MTQALEICYEDALPLAWRRPADTAGHGSAHLEDANITFLRHMAALEDHASEPSGDEYGESHPDLVRLEAKVGVLLELVGRLLVQQLTLPAKTSIRLTTGGIQWLVASGTAQIPPGRGQRLELDLFLHPNLPLPLSLSGTVDAVTCEESGAQRVHVTFLDVAPAVRNHLERIIFRRHRRSVARARQDTDGS